MLRERIVDRRFSIIIQAISGRSLIFSCLIDQIWKIVHPVFDPTSETGPTTRNTRRRTTSASPNEEEIIEGRELPPRRTSAQAKNLRFAKTIPSTNASLAESSWRRIVVRRCQLGERALDVKIKVLLRRFACLSMRMKISLGEPSQKRFCRRRNPTKGYRHWREFLLDETWLARNGRKRIPAQGRKSHARIVTSTQVFGLF